MKSARTPRVWVNVTIASDKKPTVELPKRTAHHLITVLRAADGDTVELFNGDGNNYLASLELRRRKVLATVISTTTNLNESSMKSVLIQSISRGDRMDTTVQKCVELGISRIQPVYTKHSIPALKGDRATRKLEHWQAIAISAAEQSGRSVVPEICPALTLTDWLSTSWQSEADEGIRGWVLDPRAQTTLAAHNPKSGSHHAILVGPETGLEPSEIAQATQAGFYAIRFGNRILRTETAGPAVLTSLQTLYGDLLA